MKEPELMYFNVTHLIYHLLIGNNQLTSKIQMISFRSRALVKSFVGFDILRKKPVTFNIWKSFFSPIIFLLSLGKHTVREIRSTWFLMNVSPLLKRGCDFTLVSLFARYLENN